VREGQIEAKSELLTATINAIYVSEDVSRAWSYLGQGVQAAYPDSDPRLYCRSDQALRLIFPVEKDEHHKLILLGDSRHPGIVEALSGPDYSVWASEDTRLLLPVRDGSVGTFSIGLASFGRLKAQSSPFQQREEILQLVEFLHQAARAIESRKQFTSLLRAAEIRSDKLNALNRTLTSLLHRDGLSEEVILRVVVGAGITSGWGLEYNRCALFMPDESRKVLTACLGVGHLAREEAETDWETFRYLNLDELIDDLVVGRGVETSLHRRIKSLIFPLETDQYDLLIRCYGGREPIRSSAQQSRIETLPKGLVEAIRPPNEFALVPLTASDQILGVLYVDNKFSGTEIDSERFELLKTFANQVALILENARAHAELERQLEELDKLHQVSQVVTSTLEIQNVLDKIVKLGAGVSSDYTSIVLIEEGGGLYTSAEDFPGVFPLHIRARSNGITRRVIATGEVQAFEEVYDDATHNPELIRAEIHSYVGVPVKLRDKVLGVLFVHSLSPNAFEGQIPLLTTFANWAAIAVGNARLYMNVVATLSHVGKLQSSLIYTLSHELRTLLNEIKLSATSLLRQDVAFDRETENGFLLTINTGVDKLENLVSSILDMSKLESGHLEMDKISMAIDRIARHMIGSAQDQARRHEFVLNFPVQPLLAKGDRQRIEQVLFHLLSNAIKYSPDGGKITVCGKREGAWISISVSDEGIGIPPDEIDRVFQPFYRIDNPVTRQAGGIGLGLAICKAIAEAHGGTIQVESSLGRGSTFTFSWPAT